MSNSANSALASLVIAIAGLFPLPVYSIEADANSPLLNPAFCGNTSFPTGPQAGIPTVGNSRIPQWSGAQNQGRPFVKVELPGPNAICNDGSAAVIYVRAAPTNFPANQPNRFTDYWHIHFKGGGNCRNFTDCRKRWCAEPSSFLNSPGLMSSQGLPDLARGNGILLDSAANRFSAFNQVLFAYCSSDSWIGSTPAGKANSLDPADSTSDISRIAFMGESIVKEALLALESGLDAQSQKDDVRYKLPKLLDAEGLVVSGDSAGATGVRHHIDRIAQMYRNIPVVAALDAGGAIDLSDPRVDFSGISITPDYDSFMERWALQSYKFHSVEKTALDKSCVLSNQSGPDNHLCFDRFELAKNHIETPVLQRTSLNDQLMHNLMVTTGMINNGRELRHLTYDGLMQLQASRNEFSALAPYCNSHVTFLSNPQYALMRTLQLGPRLFQEVETWAFACLAGGCPKLVALANPDFPASASLSASFCP